MMLESKPSPQNRVPAPVPKLYRDQDPGPEPSYKVRATLHDEVEEMMQRLRAGYAGRLLVELKLSKGKVVQGYEEQLETYKAAAQTEEALFLIIDVGKMGTKLTKIRRIQAERQALGERAADIVVVDAKLKPSASKR